LQATGVVDDTNLTLFESNLWLTEIKNVDLAKFAKIKAGNFTQLDLYKIAFDIQVNETSPFLLMELADAEFKNPTKVFEANAGWFSDNNFLAEGGKVYHLQYESFVSELTVEEF